MKRATKATTRTMLDTYRGWRIADIASAVWGAVAARPEAFAEIRVIEGDSLGRERVCVVAHEPGELVQDHVFTAAGTVRLVHAWTGRYKLKIAAGGHHDHTLVTFVAAGGTEYDKCATTVLELARDLFGIEAAT